MEGLRVADLGCGHGILRPGPCGLPGAQPGQRHRSLAVRATAANARSCHQPRPVAAAVALGS